MKASSRHAQKHIEYLNAELNSPRADLWAGHREALQRDIEAQKKIIDTFKSMKDPGQPTNSDLLKIDILNTERENARRQAEHEEQLRHREKVLSERINGRQFIESVKHEFPLIPGAPSVVVEWSEDPHFYSYNENELVLSVCAAEKVFKYYDSLRSAENGGYYKTKFLINYIDPLTGEPSTYEGRYDLGDNDGGLIDHIFSFGKWQIEHGSTGSSINFNNPDDVESFETGTKIINFSDWLRSSIMEVVK